MASWLKKSGLLLFGFFRHNPTIIFSIILIVAVPAIMVSYAVWTIRSFENVLDTRVQRDAIVIHRTVELGLREVLDDDDAMHQALQGIKADIVDEISDYIIVRPTVDHSAFEVKASFIDEDRGRTLDDPQYALAWQQQQSFATVVRDPGSNERVVLVTRPLFTESGELTALATMTLSLQAHDQVVSQVFSRLVFVLIIAVAVVLLLIGNNVRLYGYAVALHKQKEIDNLKDDFMSVASHELRTPIAGLRSFLSLLDEGNFGELNVEGKSYVGEAISRIGQLDDLVEDMLDIGRIEQGRLEYSFTAIDPKESVTHIFKDLEFKAKEKGLALELLGEPSGKINVDSDHFSRVMVNLIGNAIKYTEKGKVTVQFTEREKDMVTIEIQDTGIGIPPEEVDTLFQKFSRVHTDETAKIQGTGLGLWITKALVEKMKGKIYVSSIYGEGSAFTIIFPKVV